MILKMKIITINKISRNLKMKHFKMPNAPYSKRYQQALRKEQQMTADIGGIIGKSVTKSTDYLMVGQQDYRVIGEDEMSNRQKKAIKYIE